MPDNEPKATISDMANAIANHLNPKHGAEGAIGFDVYKDAEERINTLLLFEDTSAVEGILGRVIAKNVLEIAKAHTNGNPVAMKRQCKSTLARITSHAEDVLHNALNPDEEGAG